MGGTVTLLHQFSDAQFVPFIVFEIKIIFTIVGVFDYVKYGDISFLCRTQALLTLKKKKSSGKNMVMWLSLSIYCLGAS